MIEKYDLSFLNLNSIESIILNSNGTNHGLITNGISSFNTSMPILLNPKLKGLSIIINQYIKFYSLKHNLGRLELINSWFNITEKGSVLKKHNHGEKGLSGAFYVSVGKKSVPLIFPHTQIKPYPGLLIIFPSFLDHYTKKEKEKRVVLSFNSDYK